MPSIKNKLKSRLSGRIARGATGSLAMRLTAVALALITSIILARVLGAKGLGAYAFALAVIEILLVPSMLGIPSLLGREVPAGMHHHGAFYVRGLVRQSLAVVFLFSTALALTVGLAVYQWGDKLEPGMQAPLFVALVMLPFLSLLWTNEATIRGIGRVLLAQLPLRIYRPTLVLALIAAALFTSYSLTPTDAVGINLVATWAALATSLFMWWRYRPSIEVEKRSKQMRFLSLVRSGTPFILISAFGALNTQADIVLLGILSGAEETGLYRVAHRLASSAGFPYVALIMPLGPLVAELFAQGDLAKMRYKTNMALGYAFTGALLISAVLIAFSDFFLSLFGPEFGSAGPTLTILCLAQTLNSIVITTQLLLAMSHHEKLVARNLMAGAIVNVALNLILIPHFGLEGAASATLMSTLIFGFLQMRDAQRVLNFRPTLFARVHDR